MNGTKGTGDPGTTPRNFDIQQDWFQEYDRGTELVATDAASGKELWRLAVNGIDPAKTAIAAGRVFFYADRSYASCLDSEDGQDDLEDRRADREKAARERDGASPS